MAISNIEATNVITSSVTSNDVSFNNVNCTNVTSENVTSTNISCTDVSCTDVICSSVTGTNLAGTNISGTNISCTDVSCTDVICSSVTGTNLVGTNITTGNIVLQSQTKTNTSVALLNTVNEVASTLTQSRNDTNAQELSNMSMFNINNSSGTNHMGQFNYHPLAIFYPTHDIQIRRAGAMSSNGTQSNATTTYFYLCQFSSLTSSSFTVLGRSNNISNAFSSSYGLYQDYIRDANGGITTWTLEQGKKYGVIIYSKPTVQNQLQGRSYNYGMHFYSTAYGHRMLHATYFSASEPVIGNTYSANSGYAFYIPYVFVKY